jgi:apolipoprotein N-acyltransferase
MMAVTVNRICGPRGLRGDLTACAVGAVAALAFPPLHLLPVLLLCFPCLIGWIDRAPDARRAALRGWWWGLGLNLVGLYWITEAILFEAARFWWLVPLAVPALAAVLALFVGAATGIAWYARPGWPRVLALAGAWVLADLARQFVATGFPWNPLGSVWAFPGPAGDVMIQPAAWVGVHGLTLLTVFAAGALSLSVRWRAGVAVLLLAWAGFGTARLAVTGLPATGTSVVLVQGNIAQGQKWDRTLILDIFRRYLTLTHDGVAAAGASATVVWPETASPFWLANDEAARAAIAEAAGDHPALIGSVRMGPDDRPRNTLFGLVAGGRIAGLYDKWHLVPFGEYQPDWFPLGIQIVPGGGFGAGPGPRTLHIPGLPAAGPLICYEAIFPGQVVDPDDRPDWLVNVTNDAWFGDSSGPRQHLAAARLRAVEEGLPLLRAANTGISAAFDARGHEVARLGMRQTGVVSVALPAALPAPLFARYGLRVPLLLALMMSALGLAGRRWG